VALDYDLGRIAKRLMKKQLEEKKKKRKKQKTLLFPLIHNKYRHVSG